MSEINILEDVNTLLWSTDFGSLESHIELLKGKYPDFEKTFKNLGTIMTQDRINVIDFIKKYYKNEQLGLFALLAPFGFGKTIMINKIINLINAEEITYGIKKIKPVHIRLNLQSNRNLILKKILNELDINNETELIEIIYSYIKNDEIIKNTEEKIVISWLSNIILDNSSLDYVLDKLENDSVLNMIENIILSYEKVHDVKVILIFDEVEITLRGFSEDFLYFLSMIIRYCFEREKKTFVGIIAMTTNMLKEQATLFVMLDDIGAGDVRDRISEKHISKELKLTSIAATELLTKILRFYLDTLVEKSKNSKWIEILNSNNNYGDDSYTYPITYELLEYLSETGLQKTQEGIILDFRSYLSIVAATLSAWIVDVKNKKKSFDEIIDENDVLNIRKFWELNDEIRSQSQILMYLQNNHLVSTIFKEDVIRFVENEICKKIQDEYLSNIILDIFLHTIRYNKNIFKYEELKEEFDIPDKILNNFSDIVPDTCKKYINYSYDTMLVNIEELKNNLLGYELEDIDPTRTAILEHLNEDIDNIKVINLSSYDLLKNIYVIKKNEWKVDSNNSDIIYYQTSKPWNLSLYISNIEESENVIRDIIDETNTLSIGFIINEQEEIYKSILPTGLRPNEIDLDDLIRNEITKLRSSKYYDELKTKFGDIEDKKIFYLASLILPLYYDYTDKSDYPIAFDHVDFWSTIDYKLSNPSKKIQNRWIEYKTGIKISTNYIGVVSTFLKLVISKGNQVNFMNYVPIQIYSEENNKRANLFFKKIGYRDWNTMPLEPSSFLNIIKNKYNEIILYDDSKKKLKDKSLLPKKLENSIKWIKKATEEKGNISLNEISEHFFGVKFLDDDSVSWNIPVDAKRTILLLLGLSHYYEDVYLDFKDDKLIIRDPSLMTDIEMTKIRSILIEAAKYRVVDNVLSKQSKSLGKIKTFWAKLNNIETDKKLKADKKNKLVNQLSKEVNESKILLEITTDTDLKDINLKIESLLKSKVIEKDYRGLGEYLKEIKGVFTFLVPDKYILINKLNELLYEIQYEVNTLEINNKRNKILENLGDMHNEINYMIEPNVIMFLKELNKELIGKKGENWITKFKDEYEDILVNESINNFRYKKINTKKIRDYIYTYIPNLKSNVKNTMYGNITKDVDRLISEFETKSFELEGNLNEWLDKCDELSKKNYVDASNKTMLRKLAGDIRYYLQTTNLDPESNYIESNFREGEELLDHTSKSFGVVTSSFGDETTIEILNTCHKYNYNIITILEKEYNTDIIKILISNNLNEKELQAKQFFKEILDLGKKYKISMKIEW